jgi:uncharacterized repeat protein (TIGR01451 family)
LNITNSNFTDNNATASDGAAIYSMDTLNVTGSTFTNNGGGAIINEFSTLNVTDSTFIGNSAIYYGGAIYNDGNSTISNSTFTNNTAHDGGAISSFGNLTIYGNNFTDNHATEYGGAIYIEGNSTVNFNRFNNNTATYGNALYCNIGSVNAENNWWGSNENPKNITNLIAGLVNNVDADPWIILTINANPTNINNKGISTITADLQHNSNGDYLDPLNGHIPDGPITLDIPWGSLIDSTSTQLGAYTPPAMYPSVQATSNPGITHSITINTINGLITAIFYANEGAVPTENPVKVTATTDNYTTNDTESAFITINKAANLYIHITSDKNNPKVGETFTLTYKLGNHGPDPAQNVTITIPLPEGFELSNISGDGSWTYNETTNTITWTLANVPVGDPYLYITGKVTKPGIYVFGSSIISETYNINTEGVNTITINAVAEAKAASKTIGMQETGIPIAGLIMGILMLLGGLITSKK